MGTIQKELAENEEKSVHLANGHRILDYEVIRFIAAGAYGAVYEVQHVNSLHFALKIEQRSSRVRNLKMEVVVLRALQHLKSPYFCQLHFCGQNDTFCAIIMTLEGKNLNELRAEQPANRFSHHCAINIARQCLNAIQLLHSTGFIHRDIKPGNFCLSSTNRKQVVMVDFGMCRRFVDTNGKLRHPRWSTQFKGTYRYGAIATHHGRENSRKDDVESWFYVLVEFVVGTLPWYTVEDTVQVVFSKHASRTTGLKEFLSGCPKQFVHILLYIDGLQYYDAPDYALIRGLLAKAVKDGNLRDRYDWEAIDSMKTAKSCSKIGG